MFIVALVDTRLIRASMSVDTVAAATAGPGPSSAMIVVWTRSPAESLGRRAAAEAASATTRGGSEREHQRDRLPVLGWWKPPP